MTTHEALDLSLPIKPGMLRFPGDPDPVMKTTSASFGENHITMTELMIGTHLGTHVDAPGHFVKGGRTLDKIPHHVFIGQVNVIDLSHVQDVIRRSDLEAISVPRRAKVFIKTKNSDFIKSTEYKSDHVFLDPTAAQYLVDQQIQLLGFDYYNIDSSEGDALDSHLILARADTPVIVAINMEPVEPGQYWFSATPPPYVGVEAGPVRVLVWT